MHQTQGSSILVRIALLIIIGGMLLIACGSKKHYVALPDSELACPISLDWMTLKPGISTRQDVVDVLGKPDGKGRLRFKDGKKISYYAYNLDDGLIAKVAQHRIFFRTDGVIDWIEEIVVDNNGQFHTIQETVDQLGTTLDVVYTNSNFNPFLELQVDIISGPDQVLVWSECGLAMLALIDIIKSDTNELEFSPVQLDDPTILNTRHPNYAPSSRPVKDLRRVVMMKFLFQPTTFDGFVQHYSHRIPYGLWDDYFDLRKQQIP